MTCTLLGGLNLVWSSRQKLLLLLKKLVTTLFCELLVTLTMILLYLWVYIYKHRICGSSVTSAPLVTSSINVASLAPKG